MSSDTQAVESRLRITEIFYSLQGESSFVGLPTVFIRLTGCPLRCGYCDTAYAFSGGEWMQISEIVRQIKQYKTTTVCVTGGEPLAQRCSGDLLKQLCDEGYQVSIETSGSIDISSVDSRVVKVMDIKTPGSGEESKNRYENIQHLTQKDEVKFVLCDREDYEWSKEVINKYKLSEKAQILFSPVHDGVVPADLADWIISDQLNVRFQFQLHKFLWDNEPGR
ncbi:MAG: 7-carboxy-7-deazaguanine synthase QueE [endosymbiont of Galathealinum brachiosum]|uniref:7-carboxy-7-deazaguanine synthase n=1 Tax=endosymbiont of Galathealinum brachiosum TaxID=2200906 RepID=A0A370DJ34_9GAMM|nr:MAG: 7-carboxy-7-deazaguanine synthase QueE [endosymbiont of Galathealinum brachiosum]